MTDLWKHQIKIKDFEASRPASLIAAKPRTGKTLATLAFVMEKYPGSRVIVAVPKNVALVWEDEIKKHVGDNARIINATDMPGRVIDKAVAIRKMQPEPGVTDFYIVNYDIIWRENMLQVLQKSRFDVIVADESHKLKSHNSKVSKGLYVLGKTIDIKVALTGTPMPNGNQDIFGQARFLNEEWFGKNWNKFLDEYTVRYFFPGIPGAFEIVGYRNKAEFAEKLSRFLLEITWEEAALNLPPQQHITRKVKLSPAARKEYTSMARWMIAEIDSGTITASNVLVQGLRLQQITGAAKQEGLQEILEELGDEPVVVFARFHADLDLVKGTCEKLNLTSSELSGRVNNLQEWKRGDTQVLITQVESGAEGIDLSRARYSVFYSVTWNNATYEQALARVYGPNQTRSVAYYHIVAEDTIDERIYTALQHKGNTSKAVLEEVSRFRSVNR